MNKYIDAVLFPGIAAQSRRGVVRGVNLSFLQEAMPANRPTHSTAKMFRIGVIYSKFLSLNIFAS